MAQRARSIRSTGDLLTFFDNLLTLYGSDTTKTAQLAGSAVPGEGLFDVGTPIPALQQFSDYNLGLTAADEFRGVQYLRAVGAVRGSRRRPAGRLPDQRPGPQRGGSIRDAELRQLLQQSGRRRHVCISYRAADRPDQRVPAGQHRPSLHYQLPEQPGLRYLRQPDYGRHPTRPQPRSDHVPAWLDQDRRDYHQHTARQVVVYAGHRLHLDPRVRAARVGGHRPVAEPRGGEVGVAGDRSVDRRTTDRSHARSAGTERRARCRRRLC